MINGAHVILFTRDPDATRTFLRDVLGLAHVDAGEGWLIFALPPAELAVHPAEAERHELYLMCEDLEATVAELGRKGAAAGPTREASWGRLTTLTIPGGAEVGLYEPRHPRP